MVIKNKWIEEYLELWTMKLIYCKNTENKTLGQTYWLDSCGTLSPHSSAARHSLTSDCLHVHLCSVSDQLSEDVAPLQHTGG